MSYNDEWPAISVRLPNDLLVQIDALVAARNASEHGRSSRAAVVAELVALGVLELEKREP